MSLSRTIIVGLMAGLLVPVLAHAQNGGTFVDSVDARSMPRVANTARSGRTMPHKQGEGPTSTGSVRQGIKARGDPAGPSAAGTIAGVPSPFMNGPRAFMDHIREQTHLLRRISEDTGRMTDCARATREQATRQTDVLERTGRLGIEMLAEQRVRDRECRKTAGARDISHGRPFRIVRSEGAFPPRDFSPPRFAQAGFFVRQRDGNRLVARLVAQT